MKKLFQLGLMIIYCISLHAQFFEQLQPNTNHWGGVVTSVSVNPTNGNDIFLGTGSGGLYRSSNGGASWQYQGNFPTTSISYVSFCPGNSNIILVTTSFDTKTQRNGGIYRSADNGATWHNPFQSIPPVTSRCPDRCSASGISWLGRTSTVWVATDCGLMKSTDFGATWNQIIVDPAAINQYDYWDDRIRPDRMCSVLAIDENHVIAGGENGYYYMHDGRTWIRSIGAQPNFYCPRGLAVAPTNPRLLFRADYNAAYLQYSSDQGITWQNFPAPSLEAGNQAAFIRITSSSRGSRYFELYFGTGVVLKRATLTDDPSTWSSITWEQPTIDHTDPLDIAFHPVTGRPLLLVGDFGVMRTTDEGATWASSGGGVEGLNALELYGLGVQNINTGPADVTFITWHNNTWNSNDDIDWTIRNLWEGLTIRASGPELSADNEAGLSTLPWGRSAEVYAKGISGGLPGYTYPRSGDCYRHVLFFKNPVDARHYIVNVSYWCTGFNAIYDIKPVIGGSWQEIGRTSMGNPIGYPQIAKGPGTSMSLYHCYQNSAGNKWLLKTLNINRSGGTAPSFSTPRMEGFGSLSQNSFNGFEPVFAVNPNDDNILIASDATAEQMKMSIDGGNRWTPLNDLTNLVTDNGRLRYFTTVSKSQPTVISFDPFHTNRIFVGTMESGILYSLNGGRSWNRIGGSEDITRIVDIRFARDGSIYVASSGKGLWKAMPVIPRIIRIFLERSGVFVRDPMTGARVPIEIIGDPENCAACRWIIAKEGTINGYSYNASTRKLSIAATNPQSVIDYGGGSKKQMLSFNSPGNFANCPSCNESRKKGMLIEGLILKGDKIVGFIEADKDSSKISDKDLFQIQYGQQETASLSIKGAVHAPGYWMAKQGETIQLNGEGFDSRQSKTDSNFVSVYLNGQLINGKVEVMKDGKFSVAIPLKTIPGYGAIICIQGNGNANRKAELTILVMNRDGDQERKQ